MIIHSVFFWLKDDISSDERASFEQGVKMLGDIDHASAVWLGGPAATPQRAVVDASYDYALTCMFSDVAAHDAYQDDPIHHAFIERCKALWSRVVIYDADAKGLG